MKKSFLIAGVLAAALNFTTNTLSAAEEKTIVGVASAAGQFKTLVAAVKAAGLVDTLNGKGPFTVFAPTDEAFAKLPAGTVEDLLKPANKEKLAGILTYHVVSGKVMAADVKTSSVKTVNGKEADIKVDAGKVTIGAANVVKTDIAASNGVIHVIDTVLIP
ncbi:MAG: fasciclin domain-containing protein [Chthoniobacteraceae bacterium]